jgi:hypothetical protein
MHYLMPKADLIAKLKAKIEAAKAQDKREARKLESLLMRVKSASELPAI